MTNKEKWRMIERLLDDFYDEVEIRGCEEFADYGLGIIDAIHIVLKFGEEEK